MMQRENPLVSILTPTYNSKNKIDLYLQSIIKQSYRPIELILINDSSTDNTEKKIFSYKKELEDSGIIIKYIYQKNKGVSGAINTGLQMVEGEFLTWPDSDDFLSDDSIEKKVDFLEKNKSFATVTTDAYMYNEDDLGKSFGLLSTYYPRIVEEDQFELFLNEKSIFCPGCHMVRVNLLKEVNPKLKIYESRLGQNWQMLLPLYYKYKHGYINEPLFHYIVYSDSISHSKNVKRKDRIFKINERERILLNTLRNMFMPKDDRHRYRRFIKKKYRRERFLVYKEIVRLKVED